MNMIEPASCKAKAIVAASLLVVMASAAMSAEPVRQSEPARQPEPSREQLQQKLEAAQKRLDSAAREVADLSMSLSDDVLPHIMSFGRMSPQHAMLGVNIGSGSSSSRDDGVEIVSVSPGGAAAEAGLKAGDVLTQLDDKGLKRDGDESPRAKLLAAMRDVDPEQKVTVKYLRDGKPATANVVAQPAANRMFMTMPTGPGMHAMPAMPAMPFPGTRAGAIPHFAFMRADGVFGTAELVPLTAKLGQYFGTDKGLLVVRAPADARLKLEEGDVIVDIDGRVPASPTHALRILGSYQAGEQLKLNVLRMKKRLSFDITIPEDAEDGPKDDRGERGMRSHFRLDSDEPVLMPAPVTFDARPEDPI